MDDFYRPRIADKILARALRNYSAVFIKGPRACGKTTTARQVAARNILFQDARTLDTIRHTMLKDPKPLLDGPYPVLLDEWQLEPRIWGTVAAGIQENHNVPGSYIFTGSEFLNTAMTEYNATDSVTGINMWTMSLFESGDSTGEISLADLIKNPRNFKEGCVSKLTRDDIIYVMCRGGWPGCLRIEDKREQLSYSRNILNRLLDRNLHLENGRPQDQNVTKAILCAYSKNNCMLTKSEKLYKDVSYAVTDKKTVDMYVNALMSNFIVEEIDRWNLKTQPLKTKQQPKHIITDPSIAVASLNMGPDTLGVQDNSLIRGFLFESLCIRDIKIYASALDIDVAYSYYRGEDNDEVDIVLHNGGDCKVLIECKLSERDVCAAENNLLELEKKILSIEAQSTPHSAEHAPILKIALTGTDHTEKLGSGVLVIPLGCLRD